jgi:hypothetical protein
MAGNFDPNKTTFMERHTAGVNSTGKYLISGVPFVARIDGTATITDKTSWVQFPSLSREITLTVYAHAAGGQAADGVQPKVAIISFDDGGRHTPAEVALVQAHLAATTRDADPPVVLAAVKHSAAAIIDSNGGVIQGGGVVGASIDATHQLTIPVGTTITLPVRASGLRVGITSADVSVSVAATLTGIDGNPHLKYPRQVGDGEMSKQAWIS